MRRLCVFAAVSAVALSLLPCRLYLRSGSSSIPTTMPRMSSRRRANCSRSTTRSPRCRTRRSHADQSGEEPQRACHTRRSSSFNRRSSVPSNCSLRRSALPSTCSRSTTCSDQLCAGLERQSDQALIRTRNRVGRTRSAACRTPCACRPAVVGNIDTNRTQRSALVIEPGCKRRATGDAGRQPAPCRFRLSNSPISRLSSLPMAARRRSTRPSGPPPRSRAASSGVAS
jgi:hypothetical protein